MGTFILYRCQFSKLHIQAYGTCSNKTQLHLGHGNRRSIFNHLQQVKSHMDDCSVFLLYETCVIFTRDNLPS